MYQRTPPLIILGQTKIELLSIFYVSHSYLNACKALWVIKTRSLHLNSSATSLLLELVTKMSRWYVWKKQCISRLLKKKKVKLPNSPGWTPNKQFCFSKSAPFRILSPHSKLWYHICSQVVKQWWTWSCGFKVTCSKPQRSDCSPMLFLFCFPPPNALFFCHWPYH